MSPWLPVHTIFIKLFALLRVQLLFSREKKKKNYFNPSDSSQIPSPLSPPPPQKKETDKHTQFLQLWERQRIRVSNGHRRSSSIAAYFLQCMIKDVKWHLMWWWLPCRYETEHIYGPVNWIIVIPLFLGILFTPPDTDEYADLLSVTDLKTILQLTSLL